jgi:hypothetical protein
MSFGPLSTQFIEGEAYVGNVAARFNFSPIFIWGNSGDWANLNFAATNYINNGSWDNNNPNYTIQSSSFDTNTRIDFKIYLYLQAPPPGPGSNVADIGDYMNTMYVRLLRNGDPIWEGTGQNVFRYQTSDYFSWISSWVGTYSEGDNFTIQYKVANSNTDNQFRIEGVGNGRSWSGLYIRQDTSPSSGTPDSTNVLIDEGVNAAFSPYFVGMSNFLRKLTVEGDNEYFEENQAPYNYSKLWMSEAMASMYESGLTQNLDSASVLMGYSPINIPFSDIRPGDFIRFEYKKDQIFM